jgi:hypothetical protein
MHERKTLNVRNPLKPVPERLPCRLTRDERYTKIERRLALERTLDELNARIEEVKAQAKVEISEIKEEVHQVAEEMRTIREQVVSGEETRLVDCYLLEDLNEGALFVYRIDTGEVVSRKDMHPDELAKLPLEERVQKTVDVPADVARVRRFDSDAPGDALSTGPLVADPGQGEEDEEHEHTFDEGECVVCHAPEPEPEAQKPVRRKRGKGAGDETAHLRAAETH